MPSADLGTERHSAADSVTAVSFLSRSAARSPFQVWVCEGRVTGTGYNRPSPILGILCMWPSQESGRGCTGGRYSPAHRTFHAAVGGSAGVDGLGVPPEKPAAGSPDPAACTRPSSLGQLGVPGQSHTVSPGPWPSPPVTPPCCSLLPGPGLSIPGKGRAFPLWARRSAPRTPNPSTAALLGQLGTSGCSPTVASGPPTHSPCGQGLLPRQKGEVGGCLWPAPHSDPSFLGPTVRGDLQSLRGDRAWGWAGGGALAALTSTAPPLLRPAPPLTRQAPDRG